MKIHIHVYALATLGYIVSQNLQTSKVAAETCKRSINPNPIGTVPGTLLNPPKSYTEQDPNGNIFCTETNWNIKSHVGLR